jgi:hypothetical protein
MNSLSQTHRRVWEALPWILNGSASPEDTRAVHEHLRQCADCREAWAFEQRLHEAVARSQGNAPEAGEAEEGWRRLSARIEGAAGGALPARLRPPATNQVRWLAAAVIVEALALGAIVTSFWANRPVHDPLATYQTLSRPDSAHATATIRVVLAPEMTLSEFRSLLSGAHLQVVAGPGEAGVWSLAPAEDANAIATETALRELRGSAQVRFAEPINGAEQAHSP